MRIFIHHAKRAILKNAFVLIEVKCIWALWAWLEFFDYHDYVDAAINQFKNNEVDDVSHLNICILILSDVSRLPNALNAG